MAGMVHATLFRRGAIRLEQLEFHNAGFMRVLGFLRYPEGNDRAFMTGNAAFD